MKRQPVLDVPRIPEPCTQSWEAMPGTARTRHCDSCRQDVVNLAAMSMAEIRVLLAGPLPCLRIARYDDGTLVTTEPPGALRPVGIAAGFLTAAMAFGSAAAQQTQPQATMGVPPMAPVASVSGRVLDHDGKPIPALHLKLLHDHQSIRDVPVDAHGAFHVDVPLGTYEVQVQGHAIVSRSIELKADKAGSVTLPIEVTRTPRYEQNNTVTLGRMMAPPKVPTVAPPKPKPQTATIGMIAPLEPPPKPPAKQ